MSAGPLPSRTQWVLVAMMIGTLGVFAAAISSTFHWCDDYTVADNPSMHSLEGLSSFWLRPDTEQYYPLTYSTYWLLVQCGLGKASTLHAVNVLLHMASTALLFLGLLRIAPTQRQASWALLGAGIFALHPVQVESVAWIYELKNVLSTFLILLVAHAHLSFFRDRRPRYLVVALAGFALALLAKSAVLVYPVLVGLVFLYRHRLRREIVALLPFLALALASGLITIWYESARTGAVGEAYPEGMLERCFLAGKAFWFYVGKVFWPQGLAFSYPRFDLDQASWGGALLLMVPAFLPCLAVVVGRGWLRGLGLAWSAWTVTILPVLGFFNIYMMRYTYVADHFVYLPLAVGAPFLARGLVKIPMGDRVSWGVAVGLLVVLAIPTHLRTWMYKDEAALWKESLERDEKAWLPRVRLGILAKEAGRDREAMGWYESALEHGSVVEARLNLANLLAGRGRMDEAFEHFEEVLEVEPDDSGHRHALARAFAISGHFESAAEVYRSLLAQDPQDRLAEQNLQGLDTTRQELDARLDELRYQLQTSPGEEVWNELLELLVLAGHHAELVQAAKGRLAQSPADRVALENLTWVLATSPDDAVRDGEEARRWARVLETLGDPRALDVAAAAHAEAGHFEDAVRCAREGEAEALERGDVDRAGTLAWRAVQYEQERAYRSRK